MIFFGFFIPSNIWMWLQVSISKEIWSKALYSKLKQKFKNLDFRKKSKVKELHPTLNRKNLKDSNCELSTCPANHICITVFNFQFVLHPHISRKSVNFWTNLCTCEKSCSAFCCHSSL